MYRESSAATRGTLSLPQAYVEVIKSKTLLSSISSLTIHSVYFITLVSCHNLLSGSRKWNGCATSSTMAASKFRPIYRSRVSQGTSYRQVEGNGYMRVYLGRLQIVAPAEYYHQQTADHNNLNLKNPQAHCVRELHCVKQNSEATFIMKQSI